MIIKFIGKHGSMGFKYGEYYNIETKVEKNLIKIMTIDRELYCYYSNIENFLDNWEIFQKKKNIIYKCGGAKC